MLERWTPSSPEDRVDVIRALEEVLASRQFCNSKRYPALLRYIVEQTLNGHGDEIKERIIGIEVFGRPPDYDTNLDTVVRYSAGEVRKRLALYYMEAAEAPIHIGLTSRSYHLEFWRLIPSTTLEPAMSVRETAVPSLLSLPEPQRKGSHLLLWLTGTLVLALLLLLFGFQWWARYNSPVSRFWSPILQQKAPALISLGGVVFSAHSKLGTEVASNNFSLNPYLSFENGLALERVAALLNARGDQIRVQASADTSLTQMREDPTVLVGAYNNAWTFRLVQPLRFRFSSHPDESIIDARNPARSWTRDASRPFNGTPDYALVARFHDPTTDNMIVVLAGLQRFGTDAASQFATNNDLLAALNRRLSSGWEKRNVEVVLRADVVNGQVGAPTIEATQVW